MLTLQFVISSPDDSNFLGNCWVFSVFFPLKLILFQQKHYFVRIVILKFTRFVLFYFIGEEIEEVFAEDYDDPIKENATPVTTEQGMETGDSQVKPLVHEVSACPNRCFILFLLVLQSLVN